MSNDIDNMTETEIDAEMQRLHKLSETGKMTPLQADRLRRLRTAAFSIRDVKKPAYWL